jgi:hypothetical protein
MSILVLLVTFLLGGFSHPLFKDGIESRAKQLDVCSNGSCVR